MGSLFWPRAVAAPLCAGVLIVGAFAAAGCAPDQPKAPVTVDESGTPAGVDANADGVRDDVAEVIAALPVTIQMRTYLNDSAKVDQRVMTLDPTAADASATAYDIATDANRLISCVPAGLDPTDARDRAEAVRLLIANTDEREAAEAAFSKLIDGRTFPAPTCGG